MIIRKLDKLTIQKVQPKMTALSHLATRNLSFLMHNTSQTQPDVVSYLNVPRLYV